MKDVRYRRHASFKAVALQGARGLFSLWGLLFTITRIVRGLMTGEAEVPLKAAHVIVKIDDLGWFLVVMIVYMLICGLFAFMTLLFGNQLLDEFRR